MLHASDAPSLPSKIGRYEVARLLGTGAMGRVLLAHDPVLDRDVAVKVLRRDLQIPDEVRDGLIVRMRHEARAAARVSHPNLVTLHDMGEDDDVGLFLVFEYVQGPTLKQRLTEGKLAPNEAARIARELGSALTFAHEAGILHRDVKPDNVMLSATGAKMADFGIARIPDSTLTLAGGVLGTPAYSAPETFRGAKFSPESDQFSLAATLFEAVFGRRAFPGDDAVAVASKISSEPPDRLASSTGLPLELDELFARALAKLPADRFPSCEAFGATLADRLQRPPPIALPPAESQRAPTRASPPPERKAGQIVLGAAVVVVTAALLLRTALRSTSGEETVAPIAPGGGSAVPAASALAKPHPSVARPRAKAAETDPKLEREDGGGVKPAAADVDAGASGSRPDDSAAKSKLDAGP